MYGLEGLFGEEESSESSGGNGGGSKHVYAPQPSQRRPENGFVGLVNLYESGVI